MSEALQFDGGMVLIRHMRADDLAAVHALDKMSFSMPWPESSYRYELFENPGSVLWVAEAQAPAGASGVVGMIVVWLVVDEAHIATIAVHPDYRGQGIAQELLCAGLIESIERGMRSATLEVRAHNLAAQSLYRRFRFDEAGVRPRYYRDNFEDALIMTADQLDVRYLQWLRAGGWKKNVQPMERPRMSEAGATTENLQEKGHESRG